jgi:hypothetical protein
MKMEAAGSSETLVPIYQAIWCHVPEDSDLNSYLASGSFESTLHDIVRTFKHFGVMHKCSRILCQFRNVWHRYLILDLNLRVFARYRQCGQTDSALHYDLC